MHAVINLFCLANGLLLPKQIQYSNARQWIKRIITTNNLSLPLRTKPPKRLKQAKHAVKKNWPKTIEDLRILQKSINEWYGTVELTFKISKTCDAQNCSGNKEAAKQIFSASCRKWYHETCLPDDKKFFASNYYCCEK